MEYYIQKARYYVKFKINKKLYIDKDEVGIGKCNGKWYVYKVPT